MWGRRWGLTTRDPVVACEPALPFLDMHALGQCARLGCWLRPWAVLGVGDARCQENGDRGGKLLEHNVSFLASRQLNAPNVIEPENELRGGHGAADGHARFANAVGLIGKEAAGEPDPVAVA